jgi:hypothetical protein
MLLLTLAFGGQKEPSEGLRLSLVEPHLFRTSYFGNLGQVLFAKI